MEKLGEFAQRVILLAAAALSGWTDSATAASVLPPAIDGQIVGSEYANHYLAESINIELHWTIEGDFIYIGLRVPTRGWVAIAWDPSGPIMEGEDIIIGYVKEGSLYLQDYFAVTSVSHASDVSLGGRDDLLEKAGAESEQGTVLEFRRKLDTQDRFDRPLAKGTHTVQLAYAPNDDFLTYHGEKRMVVNIDFFAGGAQETGLFARPRSVEASGSLLRSWLLTVITGVALITGFSVAYLLWPTRRD